MPVSPASSWRTWIDVGRVMNTVRSVGTRLGVSQRSAQVSLLPTQHSTGGRYAHRPQNLAQTRLQQLGVGGVLTLLVLLLLYFDSGAPKAGSSQYILVQPHDSGSSSSGSSSSVSSISSSVTSGGAPLQGPAGGGGGGGGGTGVTPAAQCRALAALQVCSHRGQGGLGANDTAAAASAPLLERVAALAAAGVSCFDLDVVSTSDGKLVVGYGPHIAAALHQAGRPVKAGQQVESVPWSEYVQAGLTERYPQLAEVLEAFEKVVVQTGHKAAAAATTGSSSGSGGGAADAAGEAATGAKGKGAGDAAAGGALGTDGAATTATAADTAGTAGSSSTGAAQGATGTGTNRDSAAGAKVTGTAAAGVAGANAAATGTAAAGTGAVAGGDGAAGAGSAAAGAAAMDGGRHHHHRRRRRRRQLHQDDDAGSSTATATTTGSSSTSSSGSGSSSKARPLLLVEFKDGAMSERSVAQLHNLTGGLGVEGFVGVWLVLRPEPHPATKEVDAYLRRPGVGLVKVLGLPDSSRLPNGTLAPLPDAEAALLQVADPFPAAAYDAYGPSARHSDAFLQRVAALASGTDGGDGAGAGAGGGGGGGGAAAGAERVRKPVVWWVVDSEAEATRAARLGASAVVSNDPVGLAAQLAAAAAACDSVGDGGGAVSGAGEGEGEGEANTAGAKRTVAGLAAEAERISEGARAGGAEGQEAGEDVDGVGSGGDGGVEAEDEEGEEGEAGEEGEEDEEGEAAGKEH
ncbi:hypothetical protein CHLRE_04g219350v5 [Chlamydomonas reinhardtii]|uniref:Glycerophosphodiester phosphodiesterase n=1 Tax=Chlamydomonas reinhardtii TaxID=3055 RepID=A0A2K3DU43_CHLRE|nr:uncharacterized protein CHLRE_04g219350v5 [Chlamydomonas reinhardtii]PNW84053.1 hypothetical protein CHLRE_04g219350v5 [Chlamydomonas reinhardtii]